MFIFLSNGIFFWLGLALLLTHEMDAIANHEWRFFPATAMLNDSIGYRVFTAAHVPLYLIILLGLASPERVAWMRGLDVFFIVHVLLHLLFLRHPKYEFKTVLSWVLIICCGLCGAVDLLGVS
jgi:hypothetical protein